LLNVLQVYKVFVFNIIESKGNVIVHHFKLTVIFDAQNLELCLDSDTSKDHLLQIYHQSIWIDFKALCGVVSEHKVSIVADIELHLFIIIIKATVVNNLGFWGFGVL
jgi:hypothetical protein